MNRLFRRAAAVATTKGSASPRKPARRPRPLSVEAVERREMLAANFLQGVAFYDNNANKVFDAGDAAKSGATIQLFSSTNPNVPQATTTTNTEGYYRFDNLAAGKYKLVEVPTSSYVATDAQVNAVFNAGAWNGSSIDATVAPDSTVPTVLVSRTPGIAGGFGGVNTAFTLTTGTPASNLFTSSPNPTNAHQFQVKLVGLDGTTPVTKDFYTYCMDLYHIAPGAYGPFAVLPSTKPQNLPPAVDTNLGQIGWLYNHYGKNLAADSVDGAGLQLALYELTYDSTPNLTAGGFVVDQAQTDPAAFFAAKEYLRLANGKDERAIFLNTTDTAPDTSDPATWGTQGLLTTESFNFINTPSVSVGDTVFLDANGNGVQDAGDSGVANVTVNLLNAAGNVVGTQVTNNVGGYLFTGLVPGTYSVQFALPDGYKFTAKDQGNNDALDSDADPATGKTPTTTPAAGQSDLTLDAGIYKPVSVGDRVFSDKNGNGIQDAGETGVANVTVNLLDGNGNVLKTQTTDANGGYLFGNLAPGTYAVQFVLPNGYKFTAKDQGNNDALDSDADTVTGKTPSVTLASGQADLTLDAGLFQPASIGDFVFQDSNGNGIQDAGEPGVANVTVNLLDANGNVIKTQATDGGGKYLFSNLNPGTYSVQFVLPDGYKFTAKDQGGNDALDSDADLLTGKTTSITLTSGQTDLSFDAGIYKPVSVGDFVFLDNNLNGAQDAGEAGVANVTVRLLDGNGNVLKSQVTDGAGKYLFGDLAPGTYAVQFVLPAGYAFTTRKSTSTSGALDSDADPSTGKTSPTTLAAGQSDLTLDAGLVKLGSIGDTVFLDNNGNGIQDAGEAGVANVAVNLLDGNGNVLKSTPTDSNGKYLFDALNPGTYSVQFTLPTGYLFTLRDQGGNDAIDSDANPADGKTQSVSLGLGQNNLTLDAGLVKPVTIGDFVFLDKNGNGIQDAGEPGVANVTVNLLDANGNVIKTQATNDSGNYQFTGLLPGTYSVQFVVPTGYVFTAKDQGGNDALDSDADTVTGKTPAVTLTSGQSNLTLDAGLKGNTGSISGTKYNDLTGNGLTRDDKPLAGVTVYLDRNNNGKLDTDEQSTVTGADGKYTFSNVVAGSYVVREVVANGWVRTGPTLADNYCVTVTPGKDSGGNDFANTEAGCDCQISGVVFIINGSRQVTDLRGNVNPGDTVTARFTVRNASASDPAVFSLVSYTAPGAVFSAADASKQEVYDMYTGTYTSNGTYSIQIDVPKSYFQIDFVCGQVIDRFGPAGSNIFYTPQGRLISADNDGRGAYDNSVGRGDIGKADFWESAGGQNLIKSLNGGSSSKTLGNWLAANFSNLYGSLAGRTNAEIANLMQSLNGSCYQLEADILATALSIYVTDADLAGMNATGYGFHVSFLGSGAKKVNVGSTGTFLGLTNNTSVSLWALVDAANNKASNGIVYGSSSYNRSKVGSLFQGVNNLGSIQ